jgi:hypothetical protein
VLFLDSTMTRLMAHIAICLLALHLGAPLFVNAGCSRADERKIGLGLFVFSVPVLGLSWKGAVMYSAPSSIYLYKCSNRTQTLGCCEGQFLNPCTAIGNSSVDVCDGTRVCMAHNVAAAYPIQILTNPQSSSDAHIYGACIAGAIIAGLGLIATCLFCGFRIG